MMMDNLFNSTVETELRVLVLLHECKMPQSIDMLHAIDFMSIYAKSFGIGEYNLNGENSYMFSEFAAKRESIQGALKDLVLRGLIVPLEMDSGIKYEIDFDGEDLCDSLDSEYAAEYRHMVNQVLADVENTDEREIIVRIERKSGQVL